MNPTLGYEKTLQEMKDKNITFDQSYELNETMKVNVSLNNIEVFICDKNELKSKAFNLVIKRNLFNPF